MAKITFFIYAKESKSAPIFVRLSAGRQAPRLIVKSGLFVDSARWSDKTQTIKQRSLTPADKTLIKKLGKLRTHIETEINELYDTPTVTWLQSTVANCFKKRSADTRDLNEYITAYISEAKSGERLNDSGMSLSPGTIRGWEGFQRIFSEYQGQYSEKRLAELAKDKKKPRPLRPVTYDDITLPFYESFRNFLVAEGYVPNTVGRFIKTLKFFMQKSLDEKKHDSRDFQNRKAFKVITETVHPISLTPEELDTLYRKNLSKYPELDLARDAFIVMAETALRVSDYPKISMNIKEVRGVRLIQITQSKTGNTVTIPLTRRMELILKKYNGSLPKISDVYVNKYIKSVAQMCGMDEVIRWEVTKYGKRYEKTAQKWQMISCHTGRRSAATNMFLAGIEPIKIMKLTGHRTEREFLKYIRISDEQNAIELARHPHFNNMRAV